MSRRPLKPLPPEERGKVLARLKLGEDLLPLDLTALERKAAMSETPAGNPLPASPTGAPFIPPGSWGFRIMALLALVLGAIAIGQPDLFPNTQMDQQVAAVLVAILGFVSPGLRHKPPA